MLDIAVFMNYSEDMLCRNNIVATLEKSFDLKQHVIWTMR